jgi:hypothetical protein
MTEKQPLALMLADFLHSKYDLFPRSEQMQAAAELRRLHDMLEIAAELIRIRDARIAGLEAELTRPSMLHGEKK